MADGPNWHDIFGDHKAPEPVGQRPRRPRAQAEAPVRAGEQAPARPHTSAAVREAGDAQRQGAVGIALEEAERSVQESRLLEEHDGWVDEADGAHASTRGRRRPLPWLIAVLCVFAVVAAAVVGGWSMYGEQIRSLFGQGSAQDYAGDGFGEVTVVIEQGDIGADVASTLHEAGVTKSFQAFYDLLLEQDPAVDFVPGSFELKQQMSAKSALNALLDPASRITNRLTVVEGTTADEVLVAVSEALGAPVEELESIVADHEALGVPAEAPSIEGYLFPSTYSLEPDATPEAVIQLMVDHMMDALDDAGVPEGDRHRIVTIASLIEREAGTEEDFYKVSRVIQNRLDANMPLQFDSTAHYGAQSQGSVWTTEREREDDNPYNTYVHPGLPIGPIAVPGATAIDAALHPAEGDWLFFVAVNLKTGESAFSNTLAEHNRAIDRLDDWCRESDENAAYCR